MPKDAKTLIQLKNINKVFETEDVSTYALADIDLEIKEGEYLSISGPSGCGKSTLLSILGLLDVPSSGEHLIKGVSVADWNINDKAELRCKEVGFIFQSFNLLADLNVYENVELPLLYRDDIDKQEIKKRVDAALERVDMSHRSRHWVHQLSGGQQQRVAVARAIVGKPSLLLADEPTGNLDSKSGAAVMQLLRELNQQGTTVCMVTHDQRYADHADRIVRLLDGRLVDEDKLSSEVSPSAKVVKMTN